MYQTARSTSTAILKPVNVAVSKVNYSVLFVELAPEQMFVAIAQ